MRALCLILLWAVAAGQAPAAEGRPVLHIPADSLLTGDLMVVFPATWKFRSGDDPAWARPELDDTAWVMAPTGFQEGVAPADDWAGVGWYRIHFAVDSTLWNIPLGIRIDMLAAVDIFLDGKRICSFGTIDTASPNESVEMHIEFPVVWPIVLEPAESYVLAVRAGSPPQRQGYRFPAHRRGFELALVEPTGTAERLNGILRSKTLAHTVFGTVPLTIALLHLLLFAFYRKQRRHLYYALFTISAAAIAYLPLRTMFTIDTGELKTVFRAMSIALILTSLFGIRFVYAIYYDKLPRMFWVWAAGAAGFLIATWNGPMPVVFWFNLISFVEIVRVLTLAVIRKKRYAWIIALGAGAFVLASAFQIIKSLVTPIPADEPPYYLYGLMVMMVLMSVGLALGFAKINTELEERLEEVEKLSAKALEHERRAKEQEVARMQLEADNALKAVELEEAHKRQKVLDRLRVRNRELRQTQSQLVQSEKMASLGNLVAGVAHEINTPVGAISSMHDTLVRAVEKLKTSMREASPESFDENAKIRAALKAIEDANAVIESGSGRVTDIVKRLRSFARLDEAELKDADIHEGIEDTLSLIHHELKRGITVHKKYGKIPPIACYPGQLNQVFLNILMNARQAIDGTGEITITTRQKDGHVVIAIKDTGRGIPKHQISKVFDPGFTTKGVGVGTGLGLSICYQIVKAHKGTIDVTSVVKEGTTFTITLPTNLGSDSG